MAKDKFDLFINQDCNFLVTEFAFKLIDIKHSNSFSNAVATYESDILILKIIKDREQYSFDFYSKYDKKKNNWYDFDIVLLAARKESKYPNERTKEGLDDLYNTEKQYIKAKKNIELLKTNMIEIIALFKENSIDTIKENMNKLRNQRAKVLFG